jgi:hypothetical protein
MQQEQGVATMTDAIRDAFRTQARGSRALISNLTASVLDALAETLNHETRTGARILDWSGDPLADAMPLRIAGGLHALARSGNVAALKSLYQCRTGDFGPTIRNVLKDWDDWLYPWLDSPPQTNEVGRSGPLMAGLMVAAARLKLPIELLEIGASAGLNLNLDRFHYQMGGLSVGPDDAVVRIAPDWTGEAPKGEWPNIAMRAGVDQNPLNVRDSDVAEKLLAYCWADQDERLKRLEAAIGTAQTFPPTVDRGDAADWIEQKLAAEQEEGVARIIMHSVFWQYVPTPSQNRIEVAILAAGAAATPSRPLAWLSFEPEPLTIAPMQLTLKLWPSGESIHLATCHPHGSTINWL